MLSWSSSPVVGRPQKPDVDEALLAKLSEASLNTRHPLDPGQIDWSVPIDDTWWYAPSSGIPFYGTPWWDRFDEREQRALSRLRAASLAQAGILIEQTLTRGFIELLSQYDPAWPLSRYMLHELAEEAQHMLMFSEWVRRLGVIPPRQAWQLRMGAPMLGLSARQVPVVFFIVVIAGELTTDRLQADAAERSELHPTLRQLLRLHHVEEARHIAFARDFLERQYRELSRGERKAVRLVAPVVAQGLARTLVLIPPWEGMPSWVTPDILERASQSEVRHGLLQRAFRPLLRTFEELELIGEGERRLWQGLS